MREDVAGERADVGASTAGDRGREVGDELTGGVGQTERERAGAGKRNGADRLTPQSSERKRGSERAGWCRQAGPACQAPRARERRRARD
jgi:hypothetical protein